MEFDYDNCSLEGCISLLQSVVNSPHAYSQNKAFTKHIIDVLMQSFDEKLNLEVSIHRKLNDESIMRATYESSAKEIYLRFYA